MNDRIEEIRARLVAASAPPPEVHIRPDPDCENCDGSGCMDCRCRVWHEDCLPDCPECCTTPELEAWYRAKAELHQNARQDIVHLLDRIEFLEAALGDSTRALLEEMNDL